MGLCAPCPCVTLACRGLYSSFLLIVAHHPDEVAAESQDADHKIRTHREQWATSLNGFG